MLATDSDASGTYGPLMSQGIHRKIRPDSVWAEVRKAWEGGETARSVAKRYDVGVHALWKRREAEDWKRPDPKLGPVEPAEGWDALAERRMAEFEAKLAEVRELALVLWRAMEGERGLEMEAWHMGFVLHQRAERLGPQAAAEDRERYRDADWAFGVWDADGRLYPLSEIDWVMVRQFRDDWRRWAGLPPGAAEDLP